MDAAQKSWQPATGNQEWQINTALWALPFQSGIQISPGAEPYKHLSLIGTNTS